MFDQESLSIFAVVNQPVEVSIEWVNTEFDQG